MCVQPDQKVSGFTTLAENFIPVRFFSFHEVVRVVDIPVVSLGEYGDANDIVSVINHDGKKPLLAWYNV